MSETVFCSIGADPLDAAAVEALVRGPGDGGVCTFTGSVRNATAGTPVTHLEYEAYPEMAELEMHKIGDAVLARTGARALAMAHRIGRLEVGEITVVVSAAAAHRDAAFAACREAIDTLKAEVPIWKKEIGPNGDVWVDETARKPSNS